jgi:cytoplasmic iron level regulating protein YaaA (DUF328/UPF0246 family)
MRVALVSCVKKKRPTSAPACELYDSALFRGMRRYAETHADRWFILSAAYGLLAPDAVVAPYERTLNRMKVDARRVWSERVLESLSHEVSTDDTLIVLAGARYREGLFPRLKEMGIAVQVPLEGLKLGQQLQWLKQQSGDA